MYISQVKIDTDDRKRTRDLNRVAAIHNWVEKCFPEEFSTGKRTRKLWRIDQIRGHNYLLIVSENLPKKDRLEKYGVLGTAQTKNYDKFIKNIEEGKSYAFRIVLNPVVSKMEDPDRKRGRVKPVTNDQQMQFLYDRSEKNGFTLKQDEFSVVNRSEVIFNKSSAQKPIRLSKATYEGRLTVIDKNQFIETLTKGIGKKKAYGFGMMTVIPETIANEKT